VCGMFAEVHVRTAHFVPTFQRSNIPTASNSVPVLQDSLQRISQFNSKLIQPNFTTMSTTDSTTTATTTETEGPTLYEQASDAVAGAQEAVSSALGYEKESDAHKAGREAAEAVSQTASVAVKGVTDTAEQISKAATDAYEGAVEGSKAK